MEANIPSITISNMRYYVQPRGSYPRETTREHYRTVVRRKTSQDQIWINGGVKVARCAIYEP